MTDQQIEITEDKELETVLEEKERVLLDFYADWCGPCKMMEDVVNEVIEGDEDLVLVKVDVDAHSNIANQYNVRSIPKYVYVSEGNVLGNETGVVEKKALEELVSN